MRGDGTCEACLEATGTQTHRLHDCERMQVSMLFQFIAGRVRREPAGMRDEGWAPLLEYGLPPMADLWQPSEEGFSEGQLAGSWTGEVFGDGSGFAQERRESGIATWAVFRSADHGQSETLARGTVGGWFPTVPRAELTAYCAALRTALIPSEYIGDCGYVISGAKHGIDKTLASSRCLHADLWREARRLLLDHGPGIVASKTKAHRSEAVARLSSDDPHRWWVGNARADAHAKQLAQARFSSDRRVATRAQYKEQSLIMLQRIGSSGAWCLRHWPITEIRQKKAKGERIRPVSGQAWGEHILDTREGGGWQCGVCNLSAWRPKGLRRLKARSCRGSIEAQSHPSHRLVRKLGCVFCSVCGAHTSRIPLELRNPCKGRLRTKGYSNVLARLRSGRTPTPSTGKQARRLRRKLAGDEDDEAVKAMIARRQEEATSSQRIPPRRLFANSAEARGNLRNVQVSEVAEVPSMTSIFLSDAAAARTALRDAEGLAEPMVDKCRPTSYSSWIARAECRPEFGSVPCRGCSSLSRGRCRGCRQPLCWRCAKAGFVCM